MISAFVCVCVFVVKLTALLAVAATLMCECVHTYVSRDDVSTLEHFPELAHVNLGRMGDLFQAHKSGY